jgi:hypothetical protein
MYCILACKCDLTAGGTFGADKMIRQLKAQSVSKWKLFLSWFLKSQLRTVWLAIGLVSLTSGLSAETVNEMEVVAEDRNWQLRTSRDDFSDKISCVITNKKNKWVQVSPDHFYIAYRGRGGIKGHEYRIDNTASSGMQLPSDMDEKLGIVSYSGGTLGKILRAKRLRVQALTVLNTLENDDINLEGLVKLYIKMKSSCSE